MTALHFAAWAFVVYVGIAIVSHSGIIIGAIVLRVRAIRNFEKHQAETLHGAMPKRERFKL